MAFQNYCPCQELRGVFYTTAITSITIGTDLTTTICLQEKTSIQFKISLKPQDLLTILGQKAHDQTFCIYRRQRTLHLFLLTRGTPAHLVKDICVGKDPILRPSTALTQIKKVIYPFRLCQGNKHKFAYYLLFLIL